MTQNHLPIIPGRVKIGDEEVIINKLKEAK